MQEGHTRDLLNIPLSTLTDIYTWVCIPLQTVTEANGTRLTLGTLPIDWKAITGLRQDTSWPPHCSESSWWPRILECPTE